MDTVVDPALAAPNGNADFYANAAAALATARKAALADPEGNALNVTLEKLGRVAGAAHWITSMNDQRYQRRTARRSSSIG